MFWLVNLACAVLGSWFGMPPPFTDSAAWVGLGQRAKLGLAFNEMVRSGELKAPIVDRKSTRLNSSHYQQSRMPSSA